MPKAKGSGRGRSAPYVKKAPSGKKLLRRAAKKAARGGKPRLSSGASRPSPSMSLSGAGKAAADYAMALSDPWNAAFNTGIPMGQTGLPTFKTTKMLRLVMDSTANATTYTDPVNGIVVNLTTQGVMFDIQYTAQGNLAFYYRNGSNLNTPVLAGTTTYIPNGRIVGASMRITRMGRADDRGLRIGVSRTNQDGTEPFPTFVNDDKFQCNFFPKSNWDTDYKLNIASHPTQFTSMVSVLCCPMVASAFAVDFIAIIESNYDTPPANDHTVGSYQITVAGKTLNADPSVFPASLASVAAVAGNGSWVRSHPSHVDPNQRITESTYWNYGRDALAAVGLGASGLATSLYTGYGRNAAVGAMLGAYRYMNPGVGYRAAYRPIM